MPFDALAPCPTGRPSLPEPSLNQAERNAAVHFARQLRGALLSGETEMRSPGLLLLSLADDLAECRVRLAPAGEAAAGGEVALAQVAEEWPRSRVRRQALALRLASAAAAAWRQRQQIQRLGFGAA